MVSNAATIQSICPATPTQWRQWLADNHTSCSSVWLVYYKKHSEQFTLTWSQAVDEALCFGWIDSIRKSLDEDRFIQFFSRRKPKSGWSAINKQKVAQLVAEGRMTPVGEDCVKIAKKNGSWTLLDKAETMRIPKDLTLAFNQHRGSKPFFMRLSRSVRKTILQWITTAKRPETRKERVAELAKSAGGKTLPKRFA